MTERAGPSPSLAPFGYADGQVEALKWIALGAMFIDHFGRHLLGYGYDSWIFAAGRLAFPLFAGILALNLARAGARVARAARTARRLALWCAVSVLPSVWARGDPMVVNVLATLGLGAAVCWALASDRPLALRFGVCLAAAVAGWYVEFGIAGVMLVPAVYLACTERRADAAVLAAVLLALTAGLNASFGGWPAGLATAAAIPLALAVRQLPLSAPRLQQAFYVVYPLHLALIGMLKSAA